MRKIYAIPILVITSILVLAIALMSVNTSVPNTEISDGIDYKGSVCVYKNNELVECNHNVLYNSGANMTRTALGVGSTAAILNITLCNATAGCGTPIAASSEAYTEYGACGLAGATGTYTQLGQTGNWTVSKTFTSSCDNLLVNVTRLGNNSNYFAGNSFTLVTLANLDQLTINWTLSIT